MPILDTSDFVRKRRLAVIAKANALADPRKFRAPTRDSTYDAYRTITKNISFDDGYLQGKHYVFTSSGGGESVPPENQTSANTKNPDENPDGVPIDNMVQLLEILDFSCVEGMTYDVYAGRYRVINQTTKLRFLLTEYDDVNGPGSIITYNFRLNGQTTFVTFNRPGVLTCA